MGFCVINNIGVAANYLISKYKYKRVAVLIGIVTLEMELMIFLSLIRMFFSQAYINTHTIQVVELSMKKEIIIML